jgi:hypothetical protein
VLQVVVGGDVEDFGVANVGAVEEAEEVDACRDGDDADVLLPEELLLCFRYDACLSGREVLGDCEC